MARASGYRRSARVVVGFALIVSAGLGGPDSRSAAAQRQTVREALTSAQRPITRTSLSCGGTGPSLATLLRDTDVIAMGMIGTSSSRETRDHLDVVTDYEILQPIYLGRRPTARIPGPSSALVVTLPGGMITIDGLTFTSEHRDLQTPQPGTWCLLLLKESPEGYRLALQYFGAFAIENGLVSPLATKRGFAPELRGAVAEEVGRQMAEQLR